MTGKKRRLHWRDVQSISDVRAWVALNPNSGLALAWGQMLEEMDSFGEQYDLEMFQEEADIQANKGNG